VGLTTALADECAPHGVEVTAVLPTFTNTELLAGTSPTAVQRPIQPEEVAAAVARVLDKPTTIVSVPGRARFIAVPMQLLPPRVRRWLNKKAGNDTTFLQFDASARRGYEDRAQASIGVTRTSNGKSH
jgi:short-subunit dehydrogenase